MVNSNFGPQTARLLGEHCGATATSNADGTVWTLTRPIGTGMAVAKLKVPSPSTPFTQQQELMRKRIARVRQSLDQQEAGYRVVNPLRVV